MTQKTQHILSRLFKRYFIDAMGAMALGLFSSLIIGLILSQLSKIQLLSFLAPIAAQLGPASPVCGAAIGAAIAFSLSCDPLVLFSSTAAGAIGYVYGGPAGAYIAALTGSEIGGLISKKTPLDILLTPAATVISGGLAGIFIGKYISQFMTFLGQMVNEASVLAPLPMGILVAVIVGMALTLPISSAALCIMLGLQGLAAGSATAGCAAQMIGFAVISWRDNGIGGFFAQGLGTSMLQIPNIFRKPQIWIGPTAASAVTGALAAVIFKMENVAAGAGMGSSGLVGQITSYIVMSTKIGSVRASIYIVVLHFVLPALTAWFINRMLIRLGLVQTGDMIIRSSLNTQSIKPIKGILK